MAIRANGNGVLQLGINTDSVKVETEWRGCANPKTSEDEDGKQEDDPEHERDPDKLFTVIVSIKSFLKFLNSHVVSTTTIACEVAEAGGVLTFYVPAVIDDS
ncbi:hypothetical protein H1R20_g3023, partial [Candolleomyces eurysporus]